MRERRVNELRQGAFPKLATGGLHTPAWPDMPDEGPSGSELAHMSGVALLGPLFAFLSCSS